MYIDHTQSTNTLVREQYLDREDGFCLYTFDQRAGRGQSGNTWQSEAGKNLLFTMLLQRPKVEVGKAFLLNMAVSLGVADSIEGACIKWPNDIYIGDKKVCGILIENILAQQGIVHSIVGVGLNVNQTTWHADIPNPTSMYTESGKEYDLHELMAKVATRIKERLAQTGKPEQLKSDYMERLYRRKGYWPYVEREVSTTPTTIAQGACSGQFEAEIEDITEQGELVLRRRDESRNVYHFKQVRFVIERERIEEL